MFRHVGMVVVFALGMAAQAEAQVRLEGRVRTPDGAPVVGATVRLRGLDIEPVSTITDATGRYVFPELRGTWIVMVAWAGGRPVAEASALVTLQNEVINMTARTGAATLTTAFDLDPMEGPAGVLAGTVRGPDGGPVAGARISIRDTLITTITDSFGRYDLGRIRAGLAVTLEASAAGFGAVSREVEVVAANRTSHDFALQGEASTVERRALRAVEVPAEADALAFGRAAVTGVTAPHAGDVTRALQLLPSVRGSLEDPSSFAIRGGSPDQTTVAYEGMTLYPFSGLRGMFGGFDPAAIARVDLGEATFGDGANSVQLGAIGKVPPRRATGYVEGSAFGTGGRVIVPVTGRATLFASFRQNSTDKLYANVLKTYSANQGFFVPSRTPVFSSGSLGGSPEPGFHDANATIEIRPTDADRVSVSYYDSADAANLSRNVTVPMSSTLGVPNSDRLPAEATSEISDVYEWTGQGASATWRRQWSPRISSAVLFAKTEFEKADARSFVLKNTLTGEDYSFLDDQNGSDALKNTNRVRHTSARFESHVALGFAHGLTLGVELADLDASYVGLAERPTTGGTAKTALVQSGSQAAAGSEFRVFFSDDWRPTSKLLLTLGSRVARFDLDPSVRFEPVATATYSWMPDLQFVGAWSVTHQAATRITREDRQRGDTEFWALANGGSIAMPRVEQWSGGARFNRAKVLVDLSMFYKRFEDLTILGTEHRTITEDPITEPTLQNGTGRAAGMNLLVQAETTYNDVWASYSGGRTVNAFPTLEAGTFVASNDRTHEFKVGDTWRVTPTWSASATFVAASGLPTTTASRTLVWLDTAQQVYRTQFGVKNAGRLAAYHRLDFSSEYAVSLGRAKITLGGAVFNLYDRENVRSRTYEIAGSTIASDQTQFVGRAVNVFARFGF